MRGLVLFFVIFVASASALSAQVPGINVILAPRIGAFTALSELQDATVGTAPKVKGGMALGVSLELDIPLSPINVRANMDAALDRDLEGSNGNTKVDIVNLTGDLVFRPLPRIVVIQPYLLAGAGVKRYAFKDTQFDISEKESKFTGHLGAGVDFKLGPLGLIAEVSDYISSFGEEGEEKKLQNDLFAMVGFRIGLL